MSAELSPCLRGCGAYVLTDGPSVCVACQICEEAAAVTLAKQKAEDAKLVQTSVEHGAFVIHTRGYSVILECAGDNDYLGRHMFSNDARLLGEALIKTADQVQAMTSPFKDGSR